MGSFNEFLFFTKILDNLVTQDRPHFRAIYTSNQFRKFVRKGQIIAFKVREYNMDSATCDVSCIACRERGYSMLTFKWWQNNTI